MSNRLWRGWFNSDAGVVGRTFVLNGVPDDRTSTLPPYGGIPSDVEVPGKPQLEKRRALSGLAACYFPHAALRASVRSSR